MNSMLERGVGIDEVVDSSGLSRATVYRLIKEARNVDEAEFIEYGAHRIASWNPPPRGSDVDALPIGPRRLSQNMLEKRAWLALRLDIRFGDMGAAPKLFWLEAVSAIGRIGDGLRLPLLESGFNSRAHFAKLCGADEADLDLLVRRRVLDEPLPGVLAVPVGKGLTRGEREGGDLMPKFRGAGGRGRSPGGTLHMMTGDGGAADPAASQGLESESQTIPNESQTIAPESQTIGIYRDSESQTIQDSWDSVRLPRAAAAAALDKDSNPLSSSSSSPRAGEPSQESHESRIVWDSGESQTIGSSLAVHKFACELLAAIGLDRAPKPNELGLVQRWSDQGVPAALIQGVLAAKLGEGAKPGYLGYFKEPVREAVKAAAEAPAAEVLPKGDDPEPLPWEDDENEAAALAGPALDRRYVLVRRALKRGIGDVDYRAWFRGIVLGRCEGDEVTLIVPRPFQADHVRKHYGDRLLALWQDEDPAIRRIVFEAATQKKLPHLPDAPSRTG